ncbi:MAG: hypothetical protein ABI277_06255 [Burkholderiaceae bacterium]
MRRRALLRWLFVSLCLWTQVASATGFPAGLSEGRGSFVVTDAKGDPARPIVVFTYLSSSAGPETAPIVFVTHGIGKNADAYRDVRIEHAARYRFIVAPLFDAQQWGGGEYTYASVVGTTSPGERIDVRRSDQ